MPCYRASPAFLRRGLESVLSQSYSNLELIVVNDPSIPENDDEVLHVLDDFKDDGRLRVVVHKNRVGLVNSLNEAIFLSKGEYMARADADDVSTSSRIEEQMEFARSNNYAIVGGWGLLVSENNDKVIFQIKKPVTPSDIRSKIMLHNPFLHPTVVIKKQVFKDVGLYDPRFQYTEDYELWLRIVSKGYSCANLPKYLVMIRETKKSVTRGSEWLKNRYAYLKCKIYAYRNYELGAFRDGLYLAITPIALVIHPRAAVTVGRILERLVA